MTDFVFMLRNRTTSELVRDFPKNFKMPIWTGNQSEMVKDMLAIDAMQWKLVGEYAKFCRTELNKNQFDQNDKENCLFKGNWKHKRCNITKVDTVYDDDFNINIDTLDCFQYVEGGCLDFRLVGNTIGQMADIIKGLELTDLAIKRIFG